ncbi:unnamed protein product [Adineta ricciae]|uniref:DWNN domain-containing protein n=1 Tax=Adineta ricciae TaxID=249248 RepID=A0A814CGF3_ADIRI|nr:unnamed protein product [Adineta ricciae]CAF1398891.1 unnamed protein product [Adineta ricciae]
MYLNVPSRPMSCIRYRFKSEKDFKVFPCNQVGCVVNQLKDSLIGQSNKKKLRRWKDETVYIVKDASTDHEYQNDGDFIPIYRSVIVTRRPREIYKPLTPETVRSERRQPFALVSDVIKEYEPNINAMRHRFISTETSVDQSTRYSRNDSARSTQSSTMTTCAKPNSFHKTLNHAFSAKEDTMIFNETNTNLVQLFSNKGQSDQVISVSSFSSFSRLNNAYQQSPQYFARNQSKKFRSTHYAPRLSPYRSLCKPTANTPLN